MARYRNGSFLALDHPCLLTSLGITPHHRRLLFSSFFLRLLTLEALYDLHHLRVSLSLSLSPCHSQEALLILCFSLFLLAAKNRLLLVFTLFCNSKATLS